LNSAEYLREIERYPDWYLAHLNSNGTIHDFHIINDLLVSTGKADSTDSYAATYLSLVNGLLKSGGDPAWIKANMQKLKRVEGAILAVTDSDGLTWAKPYYPYKLLMDNCKVYRGWRDWSEALAYIGHHDEAAIAHPDWWQLRTNDFPWMLIVQVAKLSDDHTSVTAALAQVERNLPSQRWPWFITESAWILQAGQ